MIEHAIVLCRYLPDPAQSSGELRFWQILQYLRSRADSLTIFCEHDGNRGFFEDLRVRPMSELNSSPLTADLALLEFWYMDPYIPVLQRYAIPVVVDSVDVEFLRREREKTIVGAEGNYYHIEKEREIAAYRAADQVWAVSDADAARIRDFNDDIVVVPNILEPIDDIPRFTEREGVCFVGSYSHQPNVDGLRWYRDTIYPHVRELPHTIIGNSAPADIAAMPGFIGGVRSSADHVRKARVSIAPLRYGAGLKGKVLEAFACGTPVVTTTIGDEGYAAGSRGAAVVTDDPVTFAQAVRQLATDEAAWSSLSRNGRDLAARYAPQAVYPILDAALQGLLSRCGGRMTRCAPPPQLLPGTERITPGKVSIVVLNWNARPFLERAVTSIIRHTREPYELVVVDNGSTDGSKDFIRQLIRSHSQIDVAFLDQPENLYFSRGFNLGLAATAEDSEYVMVFCNDVEVKEDGWLQPLMAAMQAPNVIAAGHVEPHRRLPAEATEVFLRNRPRYTDAELERRMDAFVRDPNSTYTHLYGYCFLLRRSLLATSHLYLEGGDFKQYHSDWEWCVRFKVLGFEIASAPPRVHHWHSISELIAFHPALYEDLLGKLADPAVAARYVHEGRPLYPQESGYRELQRKRESDES